MLRFTTGTVGRGKVDHAVHVSGEHKGLTACGKTATALNNATAADTTCRSCRIALSAWSIDLTPEEVAEVEAQQPQEAAEVEQAAPLADPARYAFDYPAAKGQVVTQAHARYCAEFGHSRREINGELSPLCPRCGEPVLTDHQLHVQGPNGGLYIFQGLGHAGGLPVVWVSRNAHSPLIMIDRAHFEKCWCAVDASGYPQQMATWPTAVATFNYLASTWERDKGVRYLFLGTELDNGETFAWVGNPAGGQMRVTLAELVQRFVAVPSGEETEDEVRWNQVWRCKYTSERSSWHDVRVVDVRGDCVTVRSMVEAGRRSVLDRAMFVELFRWTPEPGAENYGRAL